MRRFLIAPLLIAAIPLPAQARQDLTPARALAGRTAGKPVSCIQESRISDSQIYDSGDMLFRMHGGDIYLNTPKPKCAGLRSGVSRITRSYGGQLCRGDISQLVDFPASISVGSCAMADFVPYPRPPRPPKPRQ